MNPRRNEPRSRIDRFRDPETELTYILWDVGETKPPDEIFGKDWTSVAGPIRNQRTHDNCWGYVATDFFSALRLIMKIDSVYRTFSVKYLTFYVSERMRSIEKDRGEKKDKHQCHGFTTARALKFIKEKGVPEEDPIDAEKDFDCIADRPEENPSPIYQLDEEVLVWESNDVKDLYEMILDQPAGATVHVFQPEFRNIGSGIYQGCTSNESVYEGQHEVEVLAIKRVNGKLVALVKNSHGVRKNQPGIFFVSLTRMVIGMGRNNEIKSATFLLTNFTCPQIPRPLQSLDVPNRTESAEEKKTKSLDVLIPRPLQSLDVPKRTESGKEKQTKPEVPDNLTLHEWMIDIPDNLSLEWYVLARPAGKRCFVVSSDGTTVSRLGDGSILHRFPSALPGGSMEQGTSSGPSQLVTILDCIFHELDQTYYVIDVICWKDYPLHECTAEFRLIPLESKLAEIGACDPPSLFHEFRFQAVPFHNCDQSGLHSAYTRSLPYVKDGLLFYNKHRSGKSPLVLIWKNGQCRNSHLKIEDLAAAIAQQEKFLT